jgi:4-hydroxybenzoate polyprenyltransferase
MKKASHAIFYLKTSRPGLWFATLWLYLLPTSLATNVLVTMPFWVGILYVTFPLNFMVYGWNDAVDYETDQLNPRKNSFWFGARGTKKQLQQVWKPILIVQLALLPVLVWLGGFEIVLIFLGFVFINALYNLPRHGLRGIPPFELLCQLGYLLVVPLSIYLNSLPHLPWQTYLYLFLFAMQSHLIGEVMDIEPDKAAKRKTTATELGMIRTKWLIIAIVTAEVALLFIVYHEFIFGGMLALGILWLLADILIIYKNKTYTMGQMKLLAKASNLIAAISIIYVWYSGCLLQTAI